jgi:hypothetical protein
MFIISGRARLVIEGEGEWEIGPETAIYSPPARSTGWKISAMNR